MSVYDNIKPEKVNEIKGRVETDSALMDDVVNGIIQPYVKDLDNYVLFIKDILKDGENPPTNAELDDFSLNLATYIYFAGGMCEQLGIRDDISKAVYKEMYHSQRASIDKGTISDKDSLAELASQQEYLVSVCYTRAYRTVKSKIESAQELLTAIKKVMGRRIVELELTNLRG